MLKGELSFETKSDNCIEKRKKKKEKSKYKERQRKINRLIRRKEVQFCKP